ncbi:MAG: hypothetical protein DCC75_01280 [Proteobacteria bacterium]|nr:MAG: hypothetical protein DCC75_01280 [Pseudomonadota bacterium]
MKNYLLTPLLILVLCCTGRVQALDLDNDGTDDIFGVSILIDQSEALSWLARNSSSGQLSSLAVFGVNGDHLALAPWTDGVTPKLGKVSNNSGSLVWSLEGSDTTITFGESTDTIIAGADFDGSGIPDAARVSEENGNLVWTIYFDMFASGTVSDPIQFGVPGDTPFFANIDGVRDWLGVTRVDDSSGHVLLKNPDSGEEHSFTVRRGFALSSRPVPVAKADGTDLIMFEKVLGKRKRLTFFNPNGQIAAKKTVRGTGIVVIGNFDPNQAGQEAAVQNTNSFRIVNPFGGPPTKLDLDLDIPVDDINVNKFGVSDDDDDTADDPQLGSCSRLNPEDGNGGYIWKPNSDTTFYAVTVMPGALRGKIRKVETISSAGILIKKLAFTGCGNPDADGPRCNYKDFSLTGRNYKNQYGSIFVKVTFNTGACGTYFIDDPSKRVD